MIERGSYRVTDAIAEQPWLPNGPIPINVEWTLDVDAARALTDPEVMTEPKMRGAGAQEQV